MFVFFSQEENEVQWLPECLVRCVEQSSGHLMVLWLLVLPQRSWSQISGTCDPDPHCHLLKPWPGNEIVPTLCDSRLLDRPAQISQASVSFNYSGSS